MQQSLACTLEWVAPVKFGRWIWANEGQRGQTWRVCPYWIGSHSRKLQVADTGGMDTPSKSGNGRAPQLPEIQQRPFRSRGPKYKVYSGATNRNVRRVAQTTAGQLGVVFSVAADPSNKHVRICCSHEIKIYVFWSSHSWIEKALAGENKHFLPNGIAISFSSIDFCIDSSAIVQEFPTCKRPGICILKYLDEVWW